MSKQGVSDFVNEWVLFPIDLDEQEEVKEEGEDATDDVRTTAPALPPPPRATRPVSAKEKHRTKTIEELIFTERDFYHQMNLCCSKVIPALQEVGQYYKEWSA